MASYSVIDNNNNLVLEASLTAWTEYQPSLNISIRPKNSANQQVRALASAFIPVFLVPKLVDNMKDPNSNGMVQCNNQFSGPTSIGRFGNDFTISNNNGSGKVILDEMQWRDTINYFSLMYENAQLIKEIGRIVRMQMINVLREIGLDIPDQNGRWKSTPWYDYKLDQNQNRNNNSNTNNYSHNNNTIDGASYGNTTTGVNPGGMRVTQPSYPAPGQPNVPQMGTQPLGMNNTSVPGGNNLGSTIPLGVPMPPLPNMAGGNAQSSIGNMKSRPTSMAGGIQDALGSTF